MLSALLIGQLHHIIIMAGGIITSDVKHINQAGMILGDFLVPLDAFKFTLKGPFVLKILAPHHFHGAIHAGYGTGKIDLSVSSPADSAEDLEVGYQGIVGSLGDMPF